MESRRQRALDRLNRRRLVRQYSWTIRILGIGFWTSASLIAIGAVLSLYQGHSLGGEVDPLGTIISDAIRLEPQGIIDLGIIVLVLTPAATILVTVNMAIRQRDWLFILIGSVLLIIALSSIVLGFV